MVVIVGIGSTSSFSMVIAIKFGWFHGHLTHKDLKQKTSETENDRGGKGKRTTHGQLTVELLREWQRQSSIDRQSSIVKSCTIIMRWMKPIIDDDVTNTMP
jgi:hypothetical protein